jgi:hypothetical protein
VHQTVDEKNKSGQQAGYRDGRQGIPQLPSHPTEPVIQVNPQTLDSNVPEDEYRLGYIAGFDEAVGGQRAVVQKTDFIPSNTPTGGNAVSEATNFGYQIELLYNLKQYLTDFQERLLGVSANYQRKVDALHNEGGMMDEIHRDFVEQQLEPTRMLIARLVEHIGDNDIPAVQTMIQRLEEFL